MREQMSAWAKRLSTARGRSALAAAVGITAMLLDPPVRAVAGLRGEKSSCGGWAGHSCVSGTAGTAPGQIDRPGRRGRKNHRDDHAGNRGGADLCLGYTVGTDPVAADPCAVEGWHSVGTDSLPAQDLRRSRSM